MKAAFPLPRRTSGAVFDGARRCARRRSTATAYTLDELLDEVVAPRPELRAVEVHKRRVHYTVGGCMAELSELTADGRATRTIAVESEDPERVIAAVRELGLEGTAEHVRGPRAQGARSGSARERYAVIDVGTNSVKFHVGERARGRRLARRSSTAPRSPGSARASTTTAARRRSRSSARSTRSPAWPTRRGRHGVEAIAAVGTAGLRIAPNRDELRRRRARARSASRSR